MSSNPYQSPHHENPPPPPPAPPAPKNEFTVWKALGLMLLTVVCIGLYALLRQVFHR